MIRLTQIKTDHGGKGRSQKHKHNFTMELNITFEYSLLKVTFVEHAHKNVEKILDNKCHIFMQTTVITNNLSV